MNLIWTFDEIYICTQVNLEIKGLTHICNYVHNLIKHVSIDEFKIVKFMHSFSNDVRLSQWLSKKKIVLACCIHNKADTVFFAYAQVTLIWEEN